jgi:hypothetical protein
LNDARGLLSLKFAEKVEPFNPEFAEGVQGKLCIGEVELQKMPSVNNVQRVIGNIVL